MLLTIAATSTGTILGTLMFIGLSALLTLIILIQKPKGGGLSGAFGGAGGSQQAVFGAKTGDFLTWVTSILFILFVCTAIILVWMTRADSEYEAAPAAVISSQVDDVLDAAAAGTEATEVDADVKAAIETAVEEATEAAEAPETTPNP